MFFSGSETAFTALPLHRVNSLRREKKNWSKALSKLKHEPEKMLIAILIGNNIVNIAAASLATLISIQIAELIHYEQATVTILSTIIVTILVLLFGEIFPKTFATSHAEKISLRIAPFYLRMIKIFYPLIVVIERLMKGLTKKEKKHTVSESDLEAFIELSKQAWIFDNGQDLKIKKLLTLDDLTAEDVMTPRIKIKALSDENTLTETIDTIDRVVTLKELLRLSKKHDSETLLSSIQIAPIIKIPRSQPIDTLLEKFQKTHKHIAVVMDEYGGVEGIVSLEDIIEEVFWEIQDESDDELPPIQKNENSDWYICQSYVRMDELLSELGIQFEELNLDDEFEAETLSYFITSHLERYPQVGEEILLPIHSLEEGEEKSLSIKVLWVKKSIVGEIAVEIK